MAEVAPMPSASVISEAAANPGLLIRPRRALVVSCRRVSNIADLWLENWTAKIRRWLLDPAGGRAKKHCASEAKPLRKLAGLRRSLASRFAASSLNAPALLRSCRYPGREAQTKCGHH